jgi:hypothetical protein
MVARPSAASQRRAKFSAAAPLASMAMRPSMSPASVSPPTQPPGRVFSLMAVGIVPET